MTHRRLLLAGLAAAIAAPALAADRTVTAPLKNLFPYLEGYLSLPQGERSLFHLAYRLMQEGKPATQVRLAFLDAGQRTAVGIGPDGRIGRLPPLAMLRSGAKVELTGPEGHKVNLVLDVEAFTIPAAEMDARALAAAATQATAGARKAAGMLGAMAPKFGRAVFERAAGAEVVDAAGRAQALPMVKGEPVLDFAKYPQASRVRFARPPRRVLLDKAS